MTTTIQPMPQDISNFMDDAFEQIKIWEYKERIRSHLKHDPEALPLIQEKAKKNLPIATGVSKIVLEWILDGCTDEKQ